MTILFNSGSCNRYFRERIGESILMKIEDSPILCSIKEMIGKFTALKILDRPTLERDGIVEGYGVCCPDNHGVCKICQSGERKFNFIIDNSAQIT